MPLIFEELIMRLTAIAPAMLPNCFAAILLWVQFLLIPASANPIPQPKATAPASIILKLQDGFTACVGNTCSVIPPSAGLQFSGSTTRNAAIVVVEGDIPHFTSARFVSPSTPPSVGLRVVIRNVTLGSSGDGFPYSDREYSTGSASETFNLSLFNRHHGGFLAIQPGTNHLSYEIKQGEAAIESGQFYINVELKRVPFGTMTPLEPPTYPAVSQPLPTYNKRDYRRVEHDLIRRNPDIDPAIIRSITKDFQQYERRFPIETGLPGPGVSLPLDQLLQQQVEIYRQLDQLNLK
ncbi:MAG: hypothetical protein NW220_17710 [Leptolyngbyaceae cyanobacterium bins.349]|nr:hypothetical protein [Leptolyngbyaceae cyanobacterium bins.349]